MAIGDQALDAGFPIVPDEGEEGRLRWGGREINRTRDFIAQVLAIVPLGRAAYRDAAGITSGTADPDASTAVEGDIYFKIISTDPPPAP